MTRLLSKLKDCDGQLCEDVATYALAFVTLTIMCLSIAQI
jgi:hypothetical protein